MNILVGCKRAIDYAVKIRISPSGKSIETQNVKHSMNPFDEIAIEQAIRIKEKSLAKQVTLVSIGGAKNQDVLRTGLAMGADDAIHVKVSDEQAETLEPLQIATILQKLAVKQKSDLIILGKQAIDSDYSQTGQMLAGLLNWPQATFASKVEVDGKKVKVTREVDGGLETVEATLPLVVTTDLRLNEPRYATLPNIMKAKKKPLETMSLDDLQVTLKNTMKLEKIEEPAKRSAGKKVSSVDELVEQLKGAGVV